MSNKRLLSVTTKTGLISVVIPCFNQAHFLGEAIESVLAQTYPSFEIIVIDDGSTDNTAGVATRYSGVHYIRQNNQGLSAARNTGLRHSTGDYLVFLDADDRLLPAALESGIAYLSVHPDCAFVSGHYRLIAADGTVLPTWREKRAGTEQYFMSGPYELIGADGAILNRWPQQQVLNEHYTALLERNYIVMHATVMYRRAVFEAVGEYNPSLQACEDYDLYLRIARQFPVACHDQVVADYRQHGTNMTRNSAMMLNSVLGVLRSQWPYVQGNTIREQAYRLGEKSWQAFYVKQARGEAWAHLRRGTLKQAQPALQLLWSYVQKKASGAGQHILATTRYRVKNRYRRLTCLPVGRVNFGALRRLTPLGCNFGDKTEQSIEGYYVQRFLQGHSTDLQGCCLEIGNGDYLQQFSGPLSRQKTNNEKSSTLLPMVLADLTTAEQLPSESYDCILLPQVLQRVYDLKTAISTAARLLRPGGVLLATVPGFPLPKRVDRSYWAFTTRSTQQLLAGTFPPTHFTLKTYGNVLTATALLQGIGVKELPLEELEYSDPHYQVLIGMRAIKPAGTSES
jgi:glycosyltransferase involved in cell wall biosynthesis